MVFNLITAVADVATALGIIFVVVQVFLIMSGQRNDHKRSRKEHARWMKQMALSEVRHITEDLEQEMRDAQRLVGTLDLSTCQAIVTSPSRPIEVSTNLKPLAKCLRSPTDNKLWEHYAFLTGLPYWL